MALEVIAVEVAAEAEAAEAEEVGSVMEEDVVEEVWLENLEKEIGLVMGKLKKIKDIGKALLKSRF